jgi:hypothetical protein
MPSGIMFKLNKELEVSMLLSGVQTLPTQLWIYPPSGHL